MIKLVVFLGNPGIQYRQTRHNAAWLCSELISDLQVSQWQKKFKGQWTSTGFGEGKCIFLKPETYMNKSGESVGSALSFFKLKPENLLVVHDDLEMPYGTIGFRKGGGLAGHNGLKSIATHGGTKDFYRFRIGIGRPVHGSVSSWVMGRFSKEEEIHLSFILEKSARLIMDYTSKELKKDETQTLKIIQ